MFHRCKTKEEAKLIFRKLAKYLHPDQGGDHECFILLNECYEGTTFNYQSENKKDVKEEFKGNPGKYQKTSFKVDGYDDSDMLEIIKEIYNYAEKHKKFNTDYVDSVFEFLAEKSYITSAQYNSLVKVYYAFRMDEEE